MTMHLLFSPPLRRFVLLAGSASLLLNLALLVPSIYSLQVFDRVFASRSLDTLAMLSLLAGAALLFAHAMDVARAQALAHAGRRLEGLLGPAALGQALQRPALGQDRLHGDALRDVTRLRRFLEGTGVRAMFDAPWLPVYLLMIGLMHPLLGAVAAVGALCLAALAWLTERLTRADTDLLLQASRDTQRRAETLARHAEVIAGMGMAGAAAAAWGDRHAALLDAHAKATRRSSRLAAAARSARQWVQMTALGVGAWLVVSDHASPGIMVASTLLLGRALQPLEQLIAGWKQLIEARGAWRRIAECPAPADRDSQLALPAPAGHLAVERLVFAHDRAAPALIRNVSFELAAGESLGLIGASAGGKTTLLRLLLGLAPATAGTVRLDGADIAQWNRDALGAHIGYLPQDVQLIDGTVAHNIARLGRIDAERVVAAAQLAGAHDMILRLPAGYETAVGDGGARLSGGQRQRIALARALYGAPRLVVLDEPDAHLDAEGDAALRAMLLALKRLRSTVIVVTHRAGLLASLDKVAVLNDGAIESLAPAAAVLARLAQPARLQAVSDASRSAA